MASPFRQEHRTVAVACLPVLRDLPGGQGQDLAGQVARSDPRQDQEAGVVDEQVELLLALPWGPADPGIAGCGLPGRRR